jgi:hypothetical protein
VKGSLKTREYYLACRRDKGVLDSLIDTARYKGMSIREVCDALDYELSDAQVAKLKEMGYDVT